MKTSLMLAFALLLSACGTGFDFGGFGSRQGLTEGGEVLEDDEGDGSNGDAGDGGAGDEGDGDFDRDDCKIEDGDLGRTDVTIALDGSSVRVSSWTEKADSPGEYVAFLLEVTGDPIVFTVKAGGESYDGSGNSWSHPNGDSGPEVSAISHIDFCDNGVPTDGDDGAEGEGEEGAEGEGEEGAEGEGEDGAEGEGECPPGTEGCDQGPGDGGGAEDGGAEDGGAEDGGDAGDEDACTAEICA